MPVIAKRTKTEDRPPTQKKNPITFSKRRVVKSGTGSFVQTTVMPLTSVSTLKEYSDVFNTRPNPPLTAQYLRTYLFNQRKGNAKTKTRGEVAGSGRKPWKQKGTGRARVGSVRNPVWRHGGVSHGPVLKDWSLDFPKKMKSRVFLSVLSKKVTDSKIYYIDKIELTEGRTKDAKALIDGWNLKGSILITVSQRNENLLKGLSNLKNVEVTNFQSLNPYQIIRHTNIVFEKEALDKLKERYAKDN